MPASYEEYIHIWKVYARNEGFFSYTKTILSVAFHWRVYTSSTQISPFPQPHNSNLEKKSFLLEREKKRKRFLSMQNLMLPDVVDIAWEF